MSPLLINLSNLDKPGFSHSPSSDPSKPHTAPLKNNAPSNYHYGCPFKGSFNWTDPACYTSSPSASTAWLAGLHVTYPSNTRNLLADRELITYLVYSNQIIQMEPIGCIIWMDNLNGLSNVGQKSGNQRLITPPGETKYLCV